MISSTASNGYRKQNIADKIAYIKARKQGLDPNEQLKNLTSAYLKDLQEVTKNVTEEIFSIVEESTQQFAEHHQKVLTALPLKQENVEARDAELKLQELQMNIDKMRILSSKASTQLDEQKQHKEEQLSRLETLRGKLDKIPPAFHKYISQAGEKFCHYTARGEMEHVDVKREKRMEEIKNQTKL